MRKIFDDSHNVTISAESIVFAVFFVFGLSLLYFIRDIVIILFLAIIVMSALNPGVKWLEKRLKLPRILAILILYIVIVGFFGIALALIIPPLASEVPNLVSSLHLPNLPVNLKSFQFSLSEVGTFLSQIRASFDEVFSIITLTFSGILAFFTILVLALYLLLERDRLYRRVFWFTKNEKHVALVKEFIDQAEIQLGGWVRGQILLMVTIGVIVFFGLSLLSVPFALPLALASAFLEILPNLGPTLSAIPAVLVAYTVFGPGMAGAVTLFYIIMHQLENHLIVPNIMKKSVDVSPLTTIVTILIGLKIGGMLGALLAVPLYILLRSVYSLYLREKELQVTGKMS